MLFVLFSFFSLFVLYICNNYIQLWAASIDGLGPTWHPAIIIYSTVYISSLANKIVVVVVNLFNKYGPTLVVTVLAVTNE